MNWCERSIIGVAIFKLRDIMIVIVIMNNGTRYTVHGTRYTVHGTRYTVHGTRDTGHGTRDTGHGTRDTGHGTRDTGHGTRDTISYNFTILWYYTNSSSFAS
jgi:hypothetical protein